MNLAKLETILADQRGRGESPRKYVRTLVESIRTKDIERRYKIRFRSSLTGLGEATIITYSECDDIVHSSGTRIHLVPISEWLIKTK